MRGHDDLSRRLGVEIEIRLPLSNAKARADLDWSLLFPTIRKGLLQTLRHVT
jgi:hypothetical protein